MSTITSWTPPPLDPDVLRRLAQRIIEDGRKCQAHGAAGTTRTHDAIKTHAALMAREEAAVDLGLVPSATTIIFGMHNAEKAHPEPVAPEGSHPHLATSINARRQHLDDVVETFMRLVGWTKPEHVTTTEVGVEWAHPTCDCGWAGRLTAPGNALLIAQAHVRGATQETVEVKA